MDGFGSSNPDSTRLDCRTELSQIRAKAERRGPHAATGRLSRATPLGTDRLALLLDLRLSRREECSIGAAPIINSMTSNSSLPVPVTLPHFSLTGEGEVILQYARWGVGWGGKCSGEWMKQPPGNNSNTISLHCSIFLFIPLWEAQFF